ncbi:MAG: dockerin type I repeat-containing protein [Phycisphaerales bacterium]
MCSSRSIFLALAGALTLSAAASGRAVFNDPRGDADPHRVDPNTGPPVTLPPGRVNPDILSLSMTGWIPQQPSIDRYIGREPLAGETFHFLRLQAEFAGLLSPPGPLGMTGKFSPTLYGRSPLYLFIDIDIDNDIDTGGELGNEAKERYLANVCRFGGRPSAGGPVASSMLLRAPISGTFVDSDFFTSPQFERSGADWSLLFCGCEQITVLAKISGDGDDSFEPNEDWIIGGRFFRRAGGYREGSAAFGGSLLGAYDPVVEARFTHASPLPAEPAGRTRVTLVYPLTMQGAQQLRGVGPIEPPDLNVSNDNCVFEGLIDLVAGANSGQLIGPNFVLQSRWAGRNPGAFLNPNQWRPTVIAATAYPDNRPFPYLYTDVAFGERFGDTTGDALANAVDQADIQSVITNFDGTIFDDDATANGVVKIQNFGPNFIIHDLDYDGDVDQQDVNNPVYPAPPTCPGDLNADGTVDTMDLVMFLARFGTTVPPYTQGDLNGDGAVNTADLTGFLGRFGQAC